MAANDGLFSPRIYSTCDGSEWRTLILPLPCGRVAVLNFAECTIAVKLEPKTGSQEHRKP